MGGRNDDGRKFRHALCVAVLLVLAVLVWANSRKARDYKSAIKTMERRTEIVRNSPDTSGIVRMIGKPDKPYYRLPEPPKYRHFWE